jgi:hypothetical protein
VITGTRALVAHLTDARLALLPCTPARVADTIGDLLPEYSPVRGAAVSVPLDAARRDRPDGLGLGRANESPKLACATRMLSAARSGAGEFYVAHRDRLGRRQQAEFPVCYADTAIGRFLTITRRGADRAVWMTFLPADRRAITGKLRDLITNSR